MYRVTLQQYSVNNTEFEFLKWADAAAFIESALRGSSDYVSFQITTYETKNHDSV